MSAGPFDRQTIKHVDAKSLTKMLLESDTQAIYETGRDTRLGLGLKRMSALVPLRLKKGGPIVDVTFEYLVMKPLYLAAKAQRFDLTLRDVYWAIRNDGKPNELPLENGRAIVGVPLPITPTDLLQLLFVKGLYENATIDQAMQRSFTQEQKTERALNTAGNLVEGLVAQGYELGIEPTAGRSYFAYEP